jgi:hypothetical protein
MDGKSTWVPSDYWITNPLVRELGSTTLPRSVMHQLGADSKAVGTSIQKTYWDPSSNTDLFALLSIRCDLRVYPCMDMAATETAVKWKGCRKGLKPRESGPSAFTVSSLPHSPLRLYYSHTPITRP